MNAREDLIDKLIEERAELDAQVERCAALGTFILELETRLAQERKHGYPYLGVHLDGDTWREILDLAQGPWDY